MTRVKRNVEILNYTNTIANLNWRAKRDVPGYYGCGDCELCKLSIFGDKFKVHHSNYWYKISGWLVVLQKQYYHSPSDNVDCESSNILYLATCRLCPDNLQYAGAARDIKLQISNIQVRPKKSFKLKYFDLLN